MEIFISQQAGSIYILDQDNNLMFRPMLTTDDCFNLDIDDFDYVEFDMLKGEQLDSGEFLTDYLEGIINKLETLRNAKTI